MRRGDLYPAASIRRGAHAQRVKHFYQATAWQIFALYTLFKLAPHAPIFGARKRAHFTRSPSAGRHLQRR
jgi:hypothetical protein